MDYTDFILYRHVIVTGMVIMIKGIIYHYIKTVN